MYTLKHSSVWDIFRASLKLGLTSFGGPVAHLGYFRNEYVNKRKWLDDKSYADLVALCQFLPGPASSQVGIGIGLMRGGWLGAFAAWAGFTLPSALALVVFAYVCQGYQLADSGFVHGLKLAAVAIVAQAVWGMGKSLAPDRPRAAIAIVTTIAALGWSSAWSQVLVLLLAGIAGVCLNKAEQGAPAENLRPAYSKKTAASLLIGFFALLILSPLLRYAWDGQALVAVFDSFYRSGSLVFGGGHVVLPMLEKEVVPSGWMREDQFLTGYGAAQAVPGPLFTFAAYLGMVIHGPAGAIVAIVAIFLPAFLLVCGALPFWQVLRSYALVRSALWGINASVVGILLAALYDPVWSSSVKNPYDFGLALSLYGLLTFGKLPPWLVVLLAAVGGMGLAWLQGNG